MKRILLSFYIFLSFFIQSYSQTANWTNVGPIPFPVKTIGQVHGIGRCSQLKFHPSDANKMYTSSASGGLWYSADKGVNWTSLGTDNITNVQSASVAIDPTNDQVIYWGTGDANYYGSGVGVYKTTNGGSTWTLSNSGMGNRLVIEMLFLPTDNQTIIAATNAGIYKTTNGGSTWTLKGTATGMYDMAFKPGTNGQTIYAVAAKGFYRSLDAGETWTQITSAAFVFGSNGCRVSVSAASPNVVYVGNVGAGTVGEIYKSTDGGSTFVNARSESTKFLAGYDATGGGQGNYNFDIEVNPANANEIYVCAHVIWRSTDGGSTWTQQQSSWAYNLHTDQHHILFDPYVSGKLWNANDGGIWSNTTQGTGAWAPMSDGIAATEIYRAANSNVSKNLAYIGTQDNGGFYYNNGTWYNDRGGDWGPEEFFDFSSAYVYCDETPNRKLLPSGTSQNLNLPYTASNSAKSKYAFTPANTSIGYVTSTGKVYRCSNLTSASPSWTLIYTLPSGTVKDIEVDPGNADILYIIASDQKAYRSDNATSTATFTTLTLPAATTSGGFLAPVKSTNVVFASMGNKLYRSSDKGVTWTDISTGFPSANINGLVADRFSTTEAIYASYSLGVYYKDNTKSSWVNYSQGLPMIADITDLYYYSDVTNQGVVRVSYYGRGMWESPMVGSINDITVSLTSPLNNTTFVSPATINLAANATSASGITKVEFYNGATLIGTDLTSPYTFTWTPVGAGNYNLSALAYNTLGANKSSSGVAITVTLVCNQITGTAFGTSPYAAGSEFDKAFDGNTSTFFDASSSGSGYTGLDLGAAKVINGVRIYPRPGNEGRMNGGIFQGSNVANFSSGVVNLYTIPSTPASGWNDISITNGTAFRYVRYLSPNNGYCNVAEIQFCAPSNLPPVVNITAPANNALYPAVPATVNITATASDPDGTISKVEFYQGATLIGTDNSNPYAFSWTGVTSGTYQLTAIAYDNLNATTTSTIVTIIVGNQNPTVSITAPANNATFAQPATLNITATASDPDGTISKVEFYQGAILLGTDNTSPFAYSWTGVSAGTYALTAKAYDNTTGTATSSIVNITVTNQSPTVSITSPANNATFSAPASVTINATASDADGTISKVEFYNGATLLGTSTTSPYTYTWTSVLTGTYSLTAKAYDNNNGTTTSSVITILVGNQAPTVVLTTPANNTNFVAPATVKMDALATDIDGSITKVEFYNGATLLASVTSSPYTYTWTGVANGTYSITAKAYDNGGSTATSTAATIIVGNGCTATAWSAATTYTGDAGLGAGNGEVVSYNGRQYRAMFWSQGASYQPDTHNGAGQAWTDLGACAAANVLPTVSITAPINNATFTPGANVAINATAADADGTISSVSFYQGTTLLGSDISSPYSFTWNSVPAGTYKLAAVAFDNKGASTTSSIITIIVNSSTTPTITYNNVTKVYGDAPFAMTATSNSPGAMTYSITAGGSFASINATTGQVTILGAGTVTVQVSQVASGSYAAANQTATLTINKAALTATADNKSRVYNTTNPAFTITYTGFVNGDNASAVIASSTSTTAIISSNVGTYPITLTGGTAANYNITLVNGTLTITPATPTLTYTGPTSGAVGSVLALTATTNSTGTPTYSVTNGTGTATLAGSNLTLNTAGTVTLTVSVAANSNYAASTVNQTITINPLTTPTITYNIITKVYGDAPFAMTATSNSPGAMTYSITAGGSFASINATSGQVTILGAGTVTVQVSQVASGSYGAATKTSTLTINKASLTATADNKSRVYNTANPTFTITYTGFVNGDNSSFVTAPGISTTAITSSNVGTYPISLTGGSAANYNITLNNGTLTITQATPTLAYTGPTAGTVSSVLVLTATTNSTATPTYSVANGTGTATIAGSNLTLNTSGSVTVTVSLAATINYTAATVNQTITINTLTTPTITYNNVTKVYGDAPFAMTATSNSPGAMTYSITAGSSFASINATTGQVTILGAGTVTVQVSQVASGSYGAATKPATLTINKASLTATADNKSRVYNTANPAFTITYSGFVNGDNSSAVTAPSTSSIAITSSNVGTYPITLTGGTAANYNITLVNGTLTITPATPTLTYTGPTSGAVGSVLALTATTNSTGTPTYSVTNGTGTATLSGSNLTLNTAGTVIVTVTVAASTNYTAATVNQTITINILTTPTITYNGNTMVYGDAPFAMTATSNSPGAMTYSITAGSSFASINATTGLVTILGAGTVTVQVSQAASGSYGAATKTATLTINKANITATADNKSRVYNTANPAFTITYSGFVNGDNASVVTAPSTSTTAINSSNVGTYPIILASGSAANYNITLVNGTLTITQATPTLTYTGATSGIVSSVLALTATTSSTATPNYSVSNGTGTANLSGTNLTLSTVGTVTVTVSVVANGNYAAGSVNQTIIINYPSNQSPTVSITSPANNVTFTAPANITFTASASDPDGTISKVEFYNGANLIGTSNSSPYTYTSSNVAAGTYSITAKAYDNLNATTTSSAITIIVNACSYTAWSSSAIYVAPNRIERNGDVYEAKWWTQNNDPLTNSGTYDVWKNLGACGTNLIPSLLVTTTAINDTLVAPANFAINITSKDDEGYVARVEIYNINNLVSQFFTNTANYNFSNLPSGLYEIYVKAFDNDGLVTISDTLKFVIQSQVTGIFNPDNNARLNFYPNPITGRELTIDYPASSGPVYFSIIDMNGKELLSYKDDNSNGDQKEVLNVGSLQPGMYILKMNVDGKVYTEKVEKASRPKTK